MSSPPLEQMENGVVEKHLEAAKRAYDNQLRIDPAERERLILEHLPLVRHIAKRVHSRVPPSVMLDDLIHSGILGLIDAVNKFDPSKLVDLRIYAQHRIRGAMLDSLRGLDWSPRLLRKKGKTLGELRERLTLTLHREPTESELAQEAGYGLEELRQLEEDLLRADLATLQEQSIDEENGDGPDDQPSNEELSPYSLCYKQEIRELLRDSIGQLSDRERQILALYYYEELTMKEVGVVLGVGEARVSQMHSATVRKVRAYMSKSQPAQSDRRPRLTAH
ncbi:MAG: sigma-70 family RNA polymerase sigma factor [Terriglobia bacterium]